MYLQPDHFAGVYAADLNPATAAVMAAAQHPIDPAALSETFTGKATWRSLPSWALVATADHSIPPQAQRFMAERAGSTVVEIDSSHAVPVAHPVQTADLIAVGNTSAIINRYRHGQGSDSWHRNARPPGIPRVAARRPGVWSASPEIKTMLQRR